MSTAIVMFALIWIGLMLWMAAAGARFIAAYNARRGALLTDHQRLDSIRAGSVQRFIADERARWRAVDTPIDDPELEQLRRDVHRRFLVTMVAGVLGLAAAVLVGRLLDTRAEFSPVIIGLVVQVALAGYWGIQFARSIRKRPIPRLWAAVAGVGFVVLIATTALTWSLLRPIG